MEGSDGQKKEKQQEWIRGKKEHKEEMARERREYTV